MPKAGLHCAPTQRLTPAGEPYQVILRFNSIFKLLGSIITPQSQPHRSKSTRSCSRSMACYKSVETSKRSVAASSLEPVNLALDTRYNVFKDQSTGLTWLAKKGHLSLMFQLSTCRTQIRPSIGIQGAESPHVEWNFCLLAAACCARSTTCASMLCRQLHNNHQPPSRNPMPLTARIFNPCPRDKCPPKQITAN